MPRALRAISPIPRVWEHAPNARGDFREAEVSSISDTSTIDTSTRRQQLALVMYLFQHKAAAASEALFDFRTVARREGAEIQVAGARDHGKVSGQVHYLCKRFGSHRKVKILQ